MPTPHYDMAHVRKQRSKKLFTSASFFAGCGGALTGVDLSGGHTLYANEFMKDAADCIRANYPDIIVDESDIRELSGFDILKKLNMEVGELDHIDGSPPCSAFSMCGKREKGWGEEKKYSKTTQRVDDLFFQMTRILDEMQPKTAFFENVKGLTAGAAADVLGSNQGTLFDMLGMEDTATDLHDESIISAITNAGYTVEYRIMKASDYGGYQTRERCIFFAIRNDLVKKLGRPTFPQPTFNGGTVGQAIGHIENDPEEMDWLIGATQGLEILRWMHVVPINEHKVETASNYHPKGSYFNLNRTSWNRTCPTITATGAAQPGAAGLFHPRMNRKFTIAELKSLSGMPTDYELTGIYKDQGERLGRLVYPRMYQALGEHLYSEFLSKL